MKNADTFKHLADPTPLFEMIIFFGGLTLFLLISGLINFLISIFKEEYQLWTVLGANRSQLSLLIGGQLFLMAFIFSVVTTILSIYLADGYYSLIQSFVGEKNLPSIPFSFDWRAVLLSLFIVPLIAGTSGYYYSRKLLKIGELDREKMGDKRCPLHLITKGSFALLVLGLWLNCIYLLYSASFTSSPNVRFDRLSSIFFMLLLHLFIIYLLTPYLQIFQLKFLSKVLAKSNYTMILAKWTILYKPSYFKSLQSSVAMGITLISGFLLLAQNISARFQTDSVTETKVSFLAFLAAPIVVILANVISVTILSSHQDLKDVKQLSILGVSKQNHLWILLCYSLIQSLIVFLTSLLFNLVILVMVLFGVHLFNYSMVDYTPVFTIDLLVSVLLFVFIFITKSISILYENGLDTAKGA
ncbi:FtsX-like permease family protein [Streptococcus dentapri]|uniref:FtsX-like permease family protein n=1 Tax=Streptococcus dentapri TaxID=573564 RepID=A0ABV8CYW4_9STRE